MKEIKLTKGYVALVDDEDYERIAAHKWNASTSGNRIYAARFGRKGEVGAGRRIYMHRQVMGLTHGDAITVDHIFRLKTLDNRRSNLRLATNTEQRVNTGIMRHNTSGMRGVLWREASQKWLAYSNLGGKYKHLGLFFTKEEAHQAYVEHFQKNHPNFAGDGSEWIKV